MFLFRENQLTHPHGSTWLFPLVSKLSLWRFAKERSQTWNRPGESTSLDGPSVLAALTRPEKVDNGSCSGHSVHGSQPCETSLGFCLSGPKPTDSEGGERTGQALCPQEEQGKEPVITRLFYAPQEGPTLLTKWQRAATGSTESSKRKMSRDQVQLCIESILSPGPSTGPQCSHVTGPSTSLTLEPWDGLVFLGSEKAESGIVGNMG